MPEPFAFPDAAQAHEGAEEAGAWAERGQERSADRLRVWGLRFGGAEVEAGDAGEDRPVALRVRQHLDAGADHVCVQVVAEDELDPCLQQLGELAPALLEL